MKCVRQGLLAGTTKQFGEKAANLKLREMVDRLEQDPTMKAKIDRVKEIDEELASL